MRKAIKEYKTILSNKNLLVSSMIAVTLFILSLIINYMAGQYATAHEGKTLNDILLDNLPTINTGIIYNQGAILFYLFVTSLIISQPLRIPFVLKTISLFVLIRAFFVILTHVGPSPDMAYIASNAIVDKFTFGGDYFFSGHTGLPFLLALIFWDMKSLRIFFLIASVIFAAAVLLGHLHYSIDVFAAYFITYTIFVIAEKIFTKDNNFHI